jgi:transcriptional regulator with XRE-family HTH domain/mannose-6-phosphate isomerase-like protein (cupin superfamily)
MTIVVGEIPVQIGQRVREAREAQQMSLRELARRVDVSASFISQLERGKANPSVGTLYALVAALGTSLDALIGGNDQGTAPAAGAPATAVAGPGGWPRIDQPFQGATGRRRVQMSGVAWERLTQTDDPFVDFLSVEYQPGSASCTEHDMMRHGGREYGHVLSGRLEVQVGFETYSLGPGDSIHFDSMTPHRLSNPYQQPCTAVWFVLARRDDDRVPTTADSARLPGLE